MSTFLSPLAPSAFRFEDSDLLVVDKPIDVAVGSALPGDLLQRVREVIAERDGQQASEVYLALHEHLDRDVSGLIALSRSSRANAPLAEALQGNLHQTSFLVGATVPLNFRPQGRFDAFLVRERDGIIRRCPAKAAKSIRVNIEYRVIQQESNRVLLEVRPERGNARHVRAVLSAQTGVQVAGDSVHGGPGASRLMVHAYRLEMPHPISKQKLSIKSEIPASFEAWLRDSKEVADAESTLQRLREAASRRWALQRKTPAVPYRLVHGEGEGLDGIDVEVFGAYAVVWLGEQLEEPIRKVVLDAVAQLGFEGVYLKIRPKQASRIVDSRREDIAPANAVRGKNAPEELIVQENGLNFSCRLGDGLQTGLFLDQRDNREKLRSCMKGRLLNLFAYTCSFTVAGAIGGAQSSVSIDISVRSLEVASRNLKLNQLSEDQHVLVNDDVLAWLRRARAGQDKFDFIVLDPPSFSTTRKSRFSAKSDYRGLAASCMELISPNGGTILACTNHRGISSGEFRHWLKDASLQVQRDIIRIRSCQPQIDFPSLPGTEPHLKAFWVDIGPV